MFTEQDNKVLDAILEERKTCRSFLDKEPSKEDIEAIIKAGQLSPYASIDSKAMTPFRHYYVLMKGDPRLAVIDRLIKEQSAADLAQRLIDEESDAFLKENSRGVEKLWGMVAEKGDLNFPDPPCVIVCAEWRGARRAERQSLAHMMQNMWLKATALNLSFKILSVTESMVNNQEFCDLFDLPVGMYGFLSCIVGYAGESTGRADRATSEIHWQV